MQDVTNPKCRYEETCFYPAHEEMPKEEQIATALLQLKNNPTLFDGWAAHNGAIKADGHFLLQNHLDDLPHPLPNRCLPSRREHSWPTSIAVLVFAMAYSSCALNLLLRDSGLSPSLTSQENTPSTFLQES
jgi:hypothetical protein